MRHVRVLDLYSPRMWRWSLSQHMLIICMSVFSTYVEVILSCFYFLKGENSILHVCGGDPFIVPMSGQRKTVFSTYVEVIPGVFYLANFNKGILHVCGGDPYKATAEEQIQRYSPRMWRWSSNCYTAKQSFWVFSTYVEVIPYVEWMAYKSCSILHVCGGDPIVSILPDIQRKYSPRMWRWSLMCINPTDSIWVFSTYVEVIPTCLMMMAIWQRILHVCGGDPKTWNWQVV